MTGSPYSYRYGDPGSPYSYDYRDPGPHFHMNMGTRGPQSRGSPFSHDTGAPLREDVCIPSLIYTKTIQPYMASWKPSPSSKAILDKLDNIIKDCIPLEVEESHGVYFNEGLKELKKVNDAQPVVY